MFGIFFLLIITVLTMSYLFLDDMIKTIYQFASFFATESEMASWGKPSLLFGCPPMFYVATIGLGLGSTLIEMLLPLFLISRPAVKAQLR